MLIDDPQCYYADSSGKIDVVSLIHPMTLQELEFYKEQGYPDNSRYRFPAEYDGEEGRHELVAILAIAAWKGGFQLIVRSSKDAGTAHRGRTIVLACFRGMKHTK